MCLSKVLYSFSYRGSKHLLLRLLLSTLFICLFNCLFTFFFTYSLSQTYYLILFHNIFWLFFVSVWEGYLFCMLILQTPTSQNSLTVCGNVRWVWAPILFLSSHLWDRGQIILSHFTFLWSSDKKTKLPEWWRLNEYSKAPNILPSM